MEDLIAQKEAELGAEQEQYENRLEDVDNQLTGLEARLAGLNEQVWQKLVRKYCYPELSSIFNVFRCLIF